MPIRKISNRDYLSVGFSTPDFITPVLATDRVVNVRVLLEVKEIGTGQTTHIAVKVPPGLLVKNLKEFSQHCLINYLSGLPITRRDRIETRVYPHIQVRPASTRTFEVVWLDDISDETEAIR